MYGAVGGESESMGEYNNYFAVRAYCGRSWTDGEQLSRLVMSRKDLFPASLRAPRTITYGVDCTTATQLYIPAR